METFKIEIQEFLSRIVEIEADLTFEAEVVHQWTGTPPDAKIYVYAYYL